LDIGKTEIAAKFMDELVSPLPVELSEKVGKALS
jgi:hypothetical protein